MTTELERIREAFEAMARELGWKQEDPYCPNCNCTSCAEIGLAKFDAESMQRMTILTLQQLKERAEKAEHERDKLKDVLLRNGFVECDIAACNCGSWHARYGLRERLDEINDALREADVLNNDTGNLALRAIGKLVEQRDASIRAQNEGDASAKDPD